MGTQPSARGHNRPFADALVLPVWLSDLRLSQWMLVLPHRWMNYRRLQPYPEQSQCLEEPQHSMSLLGVLKSTEIGYASSVPRQRRITTKENGYSLKQLDSFIMSTHSYA